MKFDLEVKASMDLSDNELVWTDASNIPSSSESDLGTPNTREYINMSNNNEDSDQEKKYKKELQKELFMEPKLENSSSKKKFKSKEIVKPSIKSEPESDLESVKKKKKSKRKCSTNESYHEILNSSHDDASFLDLRVKEEASSPPCTQRKHKKNKLLKEETELQHDIKNSENDTNINNEELERKSKKRKRKHDNESLNEEEERAIVKELFSAEETIVGTCEVEGDATITDNGTSHIPDNTDYETRKKKKKKSKNRDRTISSNGFNVSNGNESAQIKSADMSLEFPLQKSTTIDILTSSNVRHSRISDRIIFEEDSQELNPEQESYPVSYKIQQFLKSQKNLHKSNIEYANDVSISKDEEIFLLNGPTELDILSLEKNSLLLEPSFRVKLGGNKYEGHLNSNCPNITLLLFHNGKHCIETLPLQGTIDLRKRLPKAHFVMDNIIENEQTNFIPLPETKCRHPLFGPDYKKAIKLSSAVRERLQCGTHEPELVLTEKKKKKKKHKVELEETIEQAAQDEGRARRKRRRSSDAAPPPASKRARAAPAWDDERAIEHNLFTF